MYGNILYGNNIYGDILFSASIDEYDVDIPESTCRIGLKSRASFTISPFAQRNPTQDAILDVTAGVFAKVDNLISVSRSLKNNPKVGIKSYGEFASKFFKGEIYLGIGNYGNFRPGLLISSSTNRLNLTTELDFIVTSPFNNFIAWSNVGSLDFTIGLDNVAGNLPLSFSGYIYSVKKLNNKTFVVYGQDGVSLIRSNGNFFGEEKLFALGLKGKHAVTNSLHEHFFILTDNELYKLSSDEKVTRLGYAEYLYYAFNPVMSFDNDNNLIFISSRGNSNFIYSTEEDCFVNSLYVVTGIHYKNNIKYAVRHTTNPNVTLVAHFITDIYDFGTRKEKYINNIEITTNYIGSELYAAVQYRVENAMNNYGRFKETPFVKMDKWGRFNLPCYGIDFKFSFKCLDVMPMFKVDSIKINGRIHDYRGSQYYRGLQ